MSDSLSLVMGASGFLGAHLIKQLCARGQRVRALAREGSNLSLIEGLPVEVYYGDVLVPDSLAKAMRGVDVVYHSVVNAQAWLRDPSPLYRVNVDGLLNSLKAAEQAGVRRFVFTSTLATIAPRADGGESDESDFFTDTEDLPLYLQCRIAAEQQFFEFIRNSSMEGVAVCPSMTYGANDLLPTPQGKMIRDASRGLMPFHWGGGIESVGIEDAAQGMRLAAERGCNGERYILTERWLSYQELFQFSARHRGGRGYMMYFPVQWLHALATVTEFIAAPLGLDNRFTPDALRCANELPRCRWDKAARELGWQPAPVWEAIAAGIDDFHQRKLGV